VVHFKAEKLNLLLRFFASTSHRLEVFEGEFLTFTFFVSVTFCNIIPLLPEAIELTPTQAERIGRWRNWRKMGKRGTTASPGSKGSISNHISIAHENNKKYYLEKWGVTMKQWNSGRGIFAHGCDIPMKDQFKTPFNLSRGSRWEDIPSFTIT